MALALSGRLKVMVASGPSISKIGWFSNGGLVKGVSRRIIQVAPAPAGPGFPLRPRGRRGQGEVGDGSERRCDPPHPPVADAPGPSLSALKGRRGPLSRLAASHDPAPDQAVAGLGDGVGEAIGIVAAAEEDLDLGLAVLDRAVRRRQLDAGDVLDAEELPWLGLA